MGRKELLDALLEHDDYQRLYHRNTKFHDALDLMVTLLPAWVAEAGLEAATAESEKLRSMQALVYGSVEETLLAMVKRTVDAIPQNVVEEMVEEVGERLVTEIVEEAVDEAVGQTEQEPWPDRFDADFEPEPVFPAPRRRRQSAKGHVVKKPPGRPKKATAKKAAKATKKATRKRSR